MPKIRNLPPFHKTIKGRFYNLEATYTWLPEAQAAARKLKRRDDKSIGPFRPLYHISAEPGGNGYKLWVCLYKKKAKSPVARTRKPAKIKTTRLNRPRIAEEGELRFCTDEDMAWLNVPGFKSKGKKKKKSSCECD